MPISFTCPHCHNSMSVADQFAGQSGPCAKCGQPITIPMPGGPLGGPLGGSMPLPSAPVKSSGGGGGGGTILIVILAVVGIGVVLCGGVLVALLLPAVQAAREAARRTSCANNLKQIAIAMHNYHDTYNAFPPAYTVDQNGKPLHSWRVLLLPYLEAQHVYQQIDLNEPWDSPRNLSAAAMMPNVFRCPSDPTSGPGSTMTNYLGVTGPGTILEGKTPVGMASITDGTSNTLLVVESSSSGVNWMEPRDMDVNAFASQWGSPGTTKHPGGGNVALADGSVRFISGSTPPQVRQALATRADGQVVPLP